MTAHSFYHAFEASFRGSREEIGERLKAYLPFVLPLVRTGEAVRAFDVGCGRGEWLELMSSIGMHAEGVDLDDGMLQDCIARNLNVRNADALTALKEIPDGSLAVVSGFHIAEHLPFENLNALIKECMRVLQPGGLLILETPNAENVTVGTLSFHMDPTHVKPLPPGLLAFLPKFHGFERTLVVRLQENVALREAESATLADVLSGVSPDYAVVAQAPGPTQAIERLDAPFSADYGLTQETLSSRFEATIAHKKDVDELREHVTRQVTEMQDQMQDDIQQSQAGVAQTQDALAANHRILNDVLESNKRILGEVLANQARMLEAIQTVDARVSAAQADALSAGMSSTSAEILRLRDEVAALRASTSWRVTAPVRVAGKVVGGVKRGVRTPRSSAKQFAGRVLRVVARQVMGRPALEGPARRLIRRFPALADRLKGLAYSQSQSDSSHTLASSAMTSISQESHLTPKARVVLARLDQTSHHDT